MRKSRRISNCAAWALAALVATGCAQQRFSTTEMTATALGAAAGGAIGFQLGGGLTQTLFAAGGSVLGGTAGYMIARRFTMSDRAMYSQVLAEALVSWTMARPAIGSIPKPDGAGPSVRPAPSIAATGCSFVAITARR